MTDELTDLARRAVSCPGWRWLPGMRVEYADKLGCRRHTRLVGGDPSAVLLDSDPLPDLSDPATVGCLLALVREAWGDPAAHAAPDGDWHIYGDMPETEYGIGDTEAAALVAALEAAP